MEEVDGTGGADLLGFAVGDYGGETLDRALWLQCLVGVLGCGGDGELEGRTRTTTPPYLMPFSTPTGKSWGVTTLVVRLSNWGGNVSMVWLNGGKEWMVDEGG